jgi:hypothetical protein
MKRTDALDVAEVRGRLKAPPAVRYTSDVRRIDRAKRIHPRRLIPRVPTGRWRSDPRPTEAVAVEAPARRESRPPAALALRAEDDDVAFRRNVHLDDVATADTASHVCEPSLGINGDVVFYTGNWFASVSLDGGQSFRFVDPENSFPDPAGMRFCCDQVVHYVRKIDTFVWLLQYTEDAQGNNVQRLAFATTPQLREGRWRLFDITSRGLGLPGVFLDFPDLAVGSNMLYVSTNGFRGNAWECTVLVRLPLAEIASGTITAQRFVWRENFSFRVAQHCAATAYFASHNTSSQVRVFRWTESAAQPSHRDVDVASWEEGSFISHTPDGHNWLARADPRMTGATLAGGELWFAWGSARGGANDRPQPFVQIARIRARDMSLLENVTLWDGEAAICYAALSTNSNREVGVSYAIGGGRRFPSHLVGILTGTRHEAVTFAGERGPADDKWGDYLTVRRMYPDQKLFAATGYTLQRGSGSSDANPSLTIFGRRGDL